LPRLFYVIVDIAQEYESNACRDGHTVSELIAGFSCQLLARVIGTLVVIADALPVAIKPQ
jgi:hypothetical protein